MARALDALRERISWRNPLPPAAPPELLGPRVQLRPYVWGFDEDELARLYRWGCDDELAELAGGGALTVTFGRFRELFLGQLPAHNSAEEQLFALLDEDGRMIGRCGLFGMRPGERSAELGMVIGESDAWGRGYGREATRVLAEFGFEQLGLDRIYLFTFRDNLRARRAFEAAGFRSVRELRRFTLERGTHIELEMEIRKTDP